MKFLAIILVVGLSGCVADADKKLIGTAAAVGDGDCRDWGNLDDQQKFEAHWKQTKAFHVLDKTVNNRELPPAYQATAAPIAPVKTETKAIK